MDEPNEKGLRVSRGDEITLSLDKNNHLNVFINQRKLLIPLSIRDVSGIKDDRMIYWRIRCESFNKFNITVNSDRFYLYSPIRDRIPPSKMIEFDQSNESQRHFKYMRLLAPLIRHYVSENRSNNSQDYMMTESTDEIIFNIISIIDSYLNLVKPGWLFNHFKPDVVERSSDTIRIFKFPVTLHSTEELEPGVSYTLQLTSGINEISYKPDKILGGMPKNGAFKIGCYFVRNNKKCYNYFWFSYNRFGTGQNYEFKNNNSVVS